MDESIRRHSSWRSEEESRLERILNRSPSSDVMLQTAEEARRLGYLRVGERLVTPTRELDSGEHVRKKGDYVGAEPATNFIPVDLEAARLARPPSARQSRQCNVVKRLLRTG